MSFTKEVSLIHNEVPNPDEADYIMREVHEGICENHLGARLLVHKLIRPGYYWPTMQKDA